jgi:HSP20 family molecular chaperone IbpA
MQATLIEVMHQQVRAIHRAVTGADLPDAEEAPAEVSPDAETEEVITRRFVELSALVQAMPSVAERIPPFAFKPPIDVFACDDAVVLELAVCGIQRADVRVDRDANTLVISGVRRESRVARGQVFHAEIARGPFQRVVPLPFAVTREPRVELEDGLLRIYVTNEVTNQGSEENSK